jgi:hypothetical protein
MLIESLYVPIDKRLSDCIVEVPAASTGDDYTPLITICQKALDKLVPTICREMLMLPVIQHFKEQVPVSEPNDSCPCQSGKKYKRCHGRDRQN